MTDSIAARVAALRQALINENPDLCAETRERVAEVDLLTQPGAEEIIGGLGIGRLRTHRNRQLSTPGVQPPAIYNTW